MFVIHKIYYAYMVLLSLNTDMPGDLGYECLTNDSHTEEGIERSRTSLHNHSITLLTQNKPSHTENFTDVVLLITF